MFTERGRTAHNAWTSTGPSPDVLLLHGYSDAADCWSPLVPALSDRWQLLAVDARGHGESGLPDEPFGQAAMAADAARVLDEDFDGRQVIVIGHSMGGLTSATLAARRPDLVRALVLEDPSLGTWRRPTSAGPTPDWLLRTRALDRETRIANCRTENPDWPDAEFLPWAISKEQFDIEVGDRPKEEAIGLAELLAEIRCPVLMLLADTEKGSVVPEAGERACVEAAASELTSIRIRGAGHSVRRDRPEAFLRELTGFLDKHR